MAPPHRQCAPRIGRRRPWRCRHLCARRRPGSVSAGTPVPGRAIAVEVDFGGSSTPIVIYSLYLVTGGRICDENLAILATVGANSRSRALPFVIAADFQVDPRTLAPFGDSLNVSAPLSSRPCARSALASTHAITPPVSPVMSWSAPASVPGWPGTLHRPISLCLAADFDEHFALRFRTHAARPTDLPVRAFPTLPLLDRRPPGSRRGRRPQSLSSATSRRQKLSHHRHLPRVRYSRRRNRAAMRS